MGELIWLCGAAWLVLAACWPVAPAAGVTLPSLESKTMLVQSTEANSAVWVHNYYTQSATGPNSLELMGVRCTEGTKSDYQYDWQQRYSEDNGQTWLAWRVYARAHACDSPRPTSGIPRAGLDQSGHRPDADDGQRSNPSHRHCHRRVF